MNYLITISIIVVSVLFLMLVIGFYFILKFVLKTFKQIKKHREEMPNYFIKIGE